MEHTLLIKIAIAIGGLVILGLALTVYEFREHIMFWKKPKKKNQ
jgi:disulfide bond formation protein DsbB